MPEQMTKINKTNDSSCWLEYEGKTPPLLVGMETCMATVEIIWWFLRKFGIKLPHDSSILLQDIYPKDAPFYHKDTCLIVFIAALLIIVRDWKQPRCFLTENGKENVTYTIEYYSRVKN